MGIVYSTDASFKYGEEKPETVTAAPGLQKLKVRLETKHRAGKAVTVVAGFEGKDADAEDLGKKLKSFCGTGGSVKEGEIIVQGDNRDKIVVWLLKNGYKLAKRV
jgi:translation initiation factor 1